MNTLRINDKVKKLANDIHSAFATAYEINESISHEWLKNIIKESFTQYHQDLMSEVVGIEELESILEDYCISGMPVLDHKIMMGYIKASLAENILPNH